MLSDEIRKAIIASGKTQMEIAEAVGINRATMSRFVRGERGLSIELIDRVAEYLDLHIVQGKRKAGSK